MTSPYPFGAVGARGGDGLVLVYYVERLPSHHSGYHGLLAVCSPRLTMKNNTRTQDRPQGPSRCRPGDLVVGADANYLPLRLEKDRGELAAGLLGLPAEIESHPGWFEPVEPSRIEPETVRLKQAFDTIPPGRRVELAIPPDPALRDLAQRSLDPGPRRVIRIPGGYAVLEIDR